MEARPGKQERGQRIGKTRAVRLCLQMGKTAHNPGVVGRRPFLGCHRHTTANCLAPTSKSDHLTLSLSSRENVLVSALRGGTRDVATPARSRWSITNSASTTALTYWYGAQSADDAIAQPSAGRSNRRAPPTPAPADTTTEGARSAWTPRTHTWVMHVGKRQPQPTESTSSSALRGHSGRRHGAQLRPAGAGVAGGGGLQREKGRRATPPQQLEGSAYVTSHRSLHSWTRGGCAPPIISSGSSCRRHEQEASVVGVGWERSSHEDGTDQGC